VSKEPHELTASEMSALFASRDLSPVEVTEACLGRIEALDAEINAFCHIDGATSMTQAEASQARWLAGEPLSPLDGVPVAVKDLLVTKGWPTRRGSLTVDPNAYIDTDAPTVARLREAGAVLIAKLATGLFASGDNWYRGQTKNPWNPARGSSGSSRTAPRTTSRCAA